MIILLLFYSHHPLSVRPNPRVGDPIPFRPGNFLFPSDDDDDLMRIKSNLPWSPTRF